MPIGRAVGLMTNMGGRNAYGSVPVLPTSSSLASNAQNILNTAIPGLNNLTSTASSNIGNELGGQVPGDVQNQIRDRSATMAVQGGMPGSSNTTGNLYGNLSLRDLGLTSLDQQQKGISDLLRMLQGYSGTVAPTFGQQQEQENARAQYSAAPDPFASAQEQERLFNKYSLRSGGGGGGGFGDNLDIPAWLKRGGSQQQLHYGLGGGLTSGTIYNP